MTRDWTREEFGITDDTPVSDIKKENKSLQEKLDIAIEAMTETLKPINDCMLRQCYNSQIIKEALEKIKEIK